MPATTERSARVHPVSPKVGGAPMARFATCCSTTAGIGILPRVTSSRANRTCRPPFGSWRKKRTSARWRRCPDSPGRSATFSGIASGDWFKNRSFSSLPRAATDQVILSDEHVGHDWLLAAEALHRVTYANARAVLRDADAFLRRED